MADPQIANLEDRRKPRSAELIEFRALAKGSLRGFATVKLPIGLILRDMPVFTGDRGPWVSLPRKQIANRDGTPKLGQNGKPVYQALVEWETRELSDGFSDAVVALIRALYPGALA